MESKGTKNGRRGRYHGRYSKVKSLKFRLQRLHPLKRKENTSNLFFHWLEPAHRRAMDKIVAMAVAITAIADGAGSY